jgi:DNA-binding IclR family transcriptional regulator
VIEDWPDSLRKLGVRPTYRTLRVLVAIGNRMSANGPGPSNREVADAAGIEDEGQTSRLLKRLEGLGLIENTGGGAANGEANAWGLTAKGVMVRLELEQWEPD